MAHDVFISYSSKDKPIADAVCSNLETAGVRCWVAPRDIAPGEDWPTAIARAIASSRIMLLIFTANANTSEDVSRELILAANSKLVIIPFKIENVEPEPGKQYYLARTHWLDAMNPPTREQIAILIQRVKTILPATDSNQKVEFIKIPPVEVAPAGKPGGKVVRGKRSLIWIPLLGIAVILLGLFAWLFLAGGVTRIGEWITSLGSTSTPAASNSPDFLADFSDPSDSGGFDSSDWYLDPDISLTSIKQIDGVMEFYKQGFGEELGVLRTNRSWSLAEVNFLQARLMLAGNNIGRDGSIAVRLADSGTWWAGCGIQPQAVEVLPYLWCGQWTSTPEPAFEYMSDPILLEFDRWYTLRIEFVPGTNEFRSTLDGEFVHSWRPAGIEGILGKDLFISIGLWTGEDTLLIGSVDDVHLKMQK
jgi:hypothetical protein